MKKEEKERCRGLEIMTNTRDFSLKEDPISIGRIRNAPPVSLQQVCSVCLISPSLSPSLHSRLQSLFDCFGSEGLLNHK